MHRQEENVGAVRNRQWLIEHAPPAEYLWLFGDDDLIVPGALASIIETLEAERPAWLPAPSLDRRRGADRRRVARPRRDAERFAGAGDLFRAYDHWLTFLSASILRADALREAMHATQTENAYIPLCGTSAPACRGRAGRAPPLRPRRPGDQLARSAARVPHADFTSLYDDGLHAGMSAAEFGATLDGLYRRDHDLCHHWRRIELEQLVRVVERFPQSAGLRGYLWTIAFEQGRRDVLDTIDGAARAVGSDVEARALIAAGEEAFAAGDAVEAARRFDAAAQVAPTLAEAWNDLAVALHHLGRPEALRAVEDLPALFVAPDDADAQSNRAVILQAA